MGVKERDMRKRRVGASPVRAAAMAAIGSHYGAL